MSVNGDSVRQRALPKGWIAVTLLLVALAGAFGYLWVKDRGASAPEIDSYLQTNLGRVSERAHTATELLMDYTIGTVEERSARLLAVSTGDFREQYETLLEGGLGKALSEANTIARARIVDGPESSFVSSDEAVAVVRVIQTTRRKGSPLPRRIYYVLRFTLTNASTDEDAPDWRVADLKILSQQST
jgi:hypothetical protein